MVAVSVGIATTAALAVCGDANGDGDVTVSDGVQALRAAAGLSSVCTEDCDVDGSGNVTITDGVNILRSAAGLTSVQNCPGEDDRVSSLIGHTLDIFGALVKVGAVGPTPAGSISPCDNPDGGFQQTSDGFVFDDCEFGEVSFTGFLGQGDGSLGFSNLQITRRGDVLTLGGTLFLDNSGENPQLSGQLDAETPILGAYVITFEQVATDGQGNTVDGALDFDVSDADIENVVRVRVTLTGGTTLPVVVTFADDTTDNFTYDTDTGELTPAAAPPLAQVRLFNIDDEIVTFLNAKEVLRARSTGPGATQDTGFVTVPGLVCGDNFFEFRVNNNPGGGGYTFGVQFRLLSEPPVLVVNRTCGSVGVQGCDDNNTTTGEVAKDVTYVCVPCGPCTQDAGTCEAPLQIPGTGRIQFHGHTSGTSNLTSPCNASSAPESVFTFTPFVTGCYEFGTCGTGFDSQLSVGDGLCPGTSGPEACFDDNNDCAGGGAGELVFGFFDAGLPVTIVLDGAGGSDSGNYTLDVRPSGRCIL